VRSGQPHIRVDWPGVAPIPAHGDEARTVERDVEAGEGGGWLPETRPAVLAAMLARPGPREGIGADENRRAQPACGCDEVSTGERQADADQHGGRGEKRGRNQVWV